MNTASPHVRFNIVIVSPTGYKFSETFREIAETLMFGLRKLNYPAQIVTNEFKEDATNIVLGGNLLDEENANRLPQRTIIYNFEQVHGSSQWITPVYVELIRRFKCWDYNERNIKMWRRFCPSAMVVHVPLGFVPELARIVARPNEDIDVLFYGVINERRAKILRELQEWGLNVVVVTGTYGAERDELIARAKLVLNVHFYESKILEVSRLSYLLSNRKAVVSEFDSETESDIDITQAVAAVPYDKLVDTCFQLAFDVDARRSLGDKGQEIFSQRNEAEILATALATVPSANSVVEVPKRINVGSGRRWNLEWLNLDVDSLWKPDLVADLNKPLPSRDAVDLGRFGVRILVADYFEMIEASHVLEHVDDVVTAMTSFLRLLRPDGVLSVEVPYDLSHGAWQDPTHVRAFNERSWIYYTEWFWYLGWTEYRFEMMDILYVLSDYGRELKASDVQSDELLRTPRAVDAMRVTFKKIALNDGEKMRAKQRWLV